MDAVIAFALRFRALMVALFMFVMVGGVIAFLQLNIEAYPDPVPPLVDIVTQNPGQSAEEIERYITIPIEVGVATAPTSARCARSPCSGSTTSNCSSPTTSPTRRRSRKS